MKAILFLATGLAALLAGCASYSGSGLVPGTSTSAEVQAVMGTPAEKDRLGDNEVWWYPRQPYGRVSYAVTLDKAGVVQSVEQRLTRQNIALLKPGMKPQEVRLVVGPPANVTRLPVAERDVWEYRWRDIDWMRLWVQFSYDGVVKEVLTLPDPEQYPVPDVERRR